MNGGLLACRIQSTEYGMSASRHPAAPDNLFRIPHSVHPPGEAGHIPVTFNRPMVGMRDVLLGVRSNDPANAEQTLALRFAIVP